MAYRPGQRVELVYTNDPYTDLCPGDQGTVIGHDLHRHTVAISWDNGSDLSMCIDAGDRIKPTDSNHVSSLSHSRFLDEASVADAEWEAIREELFSAGSLQGRRSADRWAQGPGKVVR